VTEASVSASTDVLRHRDLNDLNDLSRRTTVESKSSRSCNRRIKPTSRCETAAYSASCSGIARRLLATESDASRRTSRLSLVIMVPSSEPVDVVRRRRFSSMILRKIRDGGGFTRRPRPDALRPPTVALSGRKIIPHVMPLRMIAPVMKFAPCNVTGRTLSCLDRHCSRAQ